MPNYTPNIPNDTPRLDFYIWGPIAVTVGLIGAAAAMAYLSHGWAIFIVCANALMVSTYFVLRQGWSWIAVGLVALPILMAGYLAFALWPTPSDEADRTKLNITTPVKLNVADWAQRDPETGFYGFTPVTISAILAR